MRTLYARKRSALLDALRGHLADLAVWHDSRAGLHLMLELPSLPASAVPTLARRLLDHDVAIYSGAPYFLHLPAHAHLILGFTLPEEDRIEEGVKRLAEEVRGLVEED